MEIIIFVFFGLAALGGMAWGFWQHIRVAKIMAESADRLHRATEAEQKYHQLQTEQFDLRQQNATLQTQLQERERSYEQQRQQLEEQKKAQAEQFQTDLQTRLQEREQSHQQQLQQFEEQKKALTEQFKVLANDILEVKAKALQDSSQHGIEALLTPFKQSMESFEKDVKEMHYRETKQQNELHHELQSLKELNQKITAEAHQLSTALRGQKKLQGNWGELVLENVLENSGLRLDKDYRREVSLPTEHSSQRPDVVVYLPQNKHLIIDAKVSLNAYVEFINSDDAGVRSLALQRHVAAMNDRIMELSERNYDKNEMLNSPQVVFMFVPIESAFVEAMKADETLFQTAIQNNVLVATPTTLLTSLNIVRQLWRHEEQNKHTAELVKKADGVFNKLNTFLGNFSKIRKSLESALETYDKAEGQLVGGKGNLVKRVNEFKQLAPTIEAELPTYFTDKAELELSHNPPADD